MSTIKEIFTRIKAAFDAPIPAPAAPVATVAPIQLATDTPFKLQDGTDITIAIDDPAISTAPDVGDIVKIAGAIAPAGDYTLDDGTTFTVDATGAITIITSLEPATQPSFVAPPPAPPTIEQRIKSIEDAIAKLTIPAIPAGMEAQLQAATQKIEKQDETIRGLFELTEKLVDMPTADPVTLSGSRKDKFAQSADAMEKKFERMGDALKKLKNKNANPVNA